MSDTPHILIVEARYYEHISEELLQGAKQALDAAGATYDIINVPGAFEIPAAIRFAVKAMQLHGLKPRISGFVALGCVIRGETTHYDYVCGESARGLMDLSTIYSLAIGYGILTVENEAQALARARVSEGNKGGFAANTALTMIDLKRTFGLYPR